MSAATSEQVLPEIAPLGKAQDLTGQRFGTLVALVRVVSNDRSARWLLECDCGRLALRTNAQLVSGQKANHEACCSVCLSELRSGSYVDRASKRTFLLRKAYNITGDLYGVDYDERFVAACLEESGVDLDDAIPEQHFEGRTEARRYPGHGVHLYPIANRAGWLCWHCGKPFTKGFGCVLCIEPVCEACTELHSASGRDASMTLEAIGIEFGVKRERVRQVEGRALRKLRHPSRSRHLKEFVDPDFYQQYAVKEGPVEGLGQHCGGALSRTHDGLIYCTRCGATDRIPRDADYRKPSATLFKYRKSREELRAAELAALYEAETGVSQ